VYGECLIGCSTRGPATPAGSSKKPKESDESEDLTKDMEDPPPDTNVQEVATAKTSVPSKKDNDLQPVKGLSVYSNCYCVKKMTTLHEF